jgi:hypothetical protein
VRVQFTCERMNTVMIRTKRTKVCGRPEPPARYPNLGIDL